MADKNVCPTTSDRSFDLPYNHPMSLLADRCICLRKVEYSETSQILTLFTRTRGLVRVVAKGAHRVSKTGASKFGGGIDLLHVADAVFTDRPEKDLSMLTEWKLREGHLELRQSLRGLYLGFYAAELVSLLVEEHDPHPQLFDRLEETLLELATPQAEQAFVAFELDVLRESGYLPDLFACGSCGGPADSRSATAFSADRGAILCRSCEGAFPARSSLDGRLLGVMQYFVRMLESADIAARRLPALTRHQSDPINRLLAAYIQHTIGRRLRLPRFVLPATVRDVVLT